MLKGGIIIYMIISNIFGYSVGPVFIVILTSYNCGTLYKIQSISPQAID